jgi:hypothetical protein
MCDWRDDDGDRCDHDDLFVLDRYEDGALIACADHLGYLVLTPNVIWPLQIAWDPDADLLPQGLAVPGGKRWPLISGVVEENLWSTAP